MENYWSRLLLEEPMENLYTIWDSVAPLPRSLWKTTACPMENSMGLTDSLCMGHLGSAGKTQHMLIGILYDGASGNHLCSFLPFCHDFLMFTLNFHHMD